MELMVAESEERLGPFKVAGTETDGVLVVSQNRPYAHDEASYDAQYAIGELDLAPGERFVSILEEFGVPRGGTVLELGCGTGQLTVGMIASDHFRKVVATDGSFSFLRLARRKVDQISTKTDVQLALLTDTDLAEINEDQFDVIVMRSVLHHVLDFDTCADLLISKLRPGGVFCAYEPRAEVFLWMGTVMVACQALGKAVGVTFDEAERAHIKTFVDTVTFYLRRDIDKSEGEDKYAFWVSELLDIANRNGARMAFYPEETSGDLFVLLLSYCRYCMGFPEALVDKLEFVLKDMRPQVNAFFQGLRAPDIAGWHLFSKQRV